MTVIGGEVLAAKLVSPAYTAVIESVPVGRFAGPIPSDPANSIVVSEARLLHWDGGAGPQDLGLQIFNYKSSGPPGRVDYAVMVRGLRRA